MPGAKSKPRSPRWTPPGDVKPYIVHDENGHELVVRGAGAMADYPLELIEGIDLTKPIYEQVLRLRGS